MTRLVAKKILPQMTRFTTVPLDLYRIQFGLPVVIKNYNKPVEIGYGVEGILNGILFTSASANLKKSLLGIKHLPTIVKKKIIKHEAYRPSIFKLEKDLVLPDNLCIDHHHSGHFYLHTVTPIGKEELEKTLTDFLTMRLTVVDRKDLVDELDRILIN